MNPRTLTGAILAAAVIATGCHETPTSGPPLASAVPMLSVAQSGDEGVADAIPEAGIQQVNMTSGSDHICVGPVTGVFDNIVVPPNARCQVIDAFVRGSIKALQNTNLLVVRSEIRGSIYSDDGASAQLRNIFVWGNIDLVGVGPDPVLREVAICGAYLPDGNIKATKGFGGIDVSPFAFCNPPSQNVLAKGNLQIDDNFVYVGRGLRIFDNVVAANLQVIKTLGPSLIKNVVENFVGQNLQCFENTPPFNGTPNFARTSEGQCAEGVVEVVR